MNESVNLKARQKVESLLIKVDPDKGWNPADMGKPVDEHGKSIEAVTVDVSAVKRQVKQFVADATQKQQGVDLVMAKLIGMKTTDTLMSNVQAAECCWKRLIVKGHMIVICAEGNGGKTTIMVNAAADMSKDGLNVLYINVDSSASDLIWYHEHAQEHGYSLIAPDLHEGMSASDALSHLKEMANDNIVRPNLVIILDTLKKFTDVINKSRSKEFYATLRKLTAKGITLVCLAHTNKYNDDTGMPVFEGTGDLRNDFDELIYFTRVVNEDKTLTVTTKIDKDRAVGLKDTSFHISRDREVKEIPLVDTAAIKQFQRMLEEKAEVVEFIKSSIDPETRTANGLHDLSVANGLGFGQKEIRKVAEFFDARNCDTPLWESAMGVKNGRYYFPIGKGQNVPKDAPVRMPEAVESDGFL